MKSAPKASSRLLIDRVSDILPLLIGVVIIFSITGYLLRTSYIDALNTATVTGSNLASSVETRLDATLRRVDSILSELVFDLSSEKMSQSTAVHHIKKMDGDMDHRATHFPELAGLRIFDADGQLLYTNARHALIDRPHVEDRKFFQSLRDDPKLKRVFSETFLVRSTKTHSIGVAYPIRDKNGRFLGIALGLINLDYFQRYLSTLDIGKHGTFAIRRTDNFGLVLRQPNIESELNQVLPLGNLAREAIDAGKQKITVDFVAKTDGIRRIFSLQRLQQHPYYVLVAIAHEDALITWYERLHLTLGSLVIVLLLLAHQQRHVRRSKRSLRSSISALRLSEQFARTTIDAVPEHICVLDRDGKVLAVNKAWRDFCEQNHPHALGINYAIGSNYFDICRVASVGGVPEASQMEEGICQVSAGRWETFELEYACDSPFEKRNFIAQVTRFDGDSGNLLVSHANITERKRAEAELKLLALIFSNSNEAISISDARNQIVAINPAFTVLTGYTQEEVIGQDPKILSAGKTPPECYKEMWASINQQGKWEGELWDRRKTGEPYPKWLSISVVRDNAGKITNYIGNFIDITERKASEEKIRHLAYHDALTMLPNRFNLHERLDLALGFSRRSGKQLALMLIDLDRFKSINDTLGHHVGDELLIQVAQRITAAVRESDIVARLGGDEFVVVLPDITSPEDAAHVAKTIVATISEPYLIGGQALNSSPSIGICLYPSDATEISDLLKNADVAMYEAKAQGRSNYQFFTESMTVATTKRMALEADLREALAQRQFVLYYQPQLSLQKRTLVGVEALIRWQHPTLGMVSPLDFIPIAEETGLILPIGDWVLREACQQLKTWHNQGLTHIRMSVNLSASQFMDKALPERIEAVLADIGLDHAALDLEVTESMSMALPDQTICVMKTLTQRGLSLSIDDFGTGYSSLAYLKLFPISTLKIDRSFVKDIETDSNDADICDVTVLLAHKLGLNVVAEGVETAAQLKFLLSIGCEKIQGYLISKPLPADQAGVFIQNYPVMTKLGDIDLWPRG